MYNKEHFSITRFFVNILQGSLIGLGAVLPGISGGVLCVIFGIYKPIMEFLSAPFRNFKTHIPQLFPVILGAGIGFLGIANILSALLEKYPSQSVCLFIGLITGMLPSLFEEAGQQGRSKASYISMYISMTVIFILLAVLKMLSVQITPNFAWYLFCGFCLALSVIAPSMSFSTLLMPLGLYEPFVSGIGHMTFNIITAGGIGCLATVILLSKSVNALFTKHYSVAFHSIIGIVIAATAMTVPFESFTTSSIVFVTNILCIAFGITASLLLDRFNKKFEV